MMGKGSGHRIVCIVAAFALVFGLIPLPAFAAIAESPAGAQRPDEDIEATITDLLNAGDYVEGEAIVCSLSEAAAGPGVLSIQSADGGDLLAAAEGLSTVTARQYAEATGDETAMGSSGAGSEGLLSTQSAQEGVRISLVRNYDSTTEELIRQLLCDPRVLSAEPNYIMQFADDSAAGQHDYAVGATGTGAASHLSASTADPSLSTQASGDTTYDMTGYQWFSQGVAATTPQYLAGATNPGISSPHWNEQGAQNASGVVAIMDTGVDYNHPDLSGVMYHFSPELQAQLGCGEYGYAPIREDKTDPMDHFRHGTHCAGIVAAQWNGFGVSGIASGVQVCGVSIATSTTDSSYSYDSVVKGYDFLVRAAKAGVDIRAVNCSFGSSPTNNAAAAMVQAAGEAGIVTCVAAGNDSTDLDATFDDIATKQQSPYVLRVDASRQQDDRAWFSCYGHYMTDVFSPGSGILSTVPTLVDSTWRYFPQADSAPLYSETSFDGALPRVYLQKYNSEGEEEFVSLEVSKADDIGVDGDGRSAKFNANIRVAAPLELVVDVPVSESLDLSAMQDIGFALYCDDFDMTGMQLSVLLDDDTYLSDGNQRVSVNRSDNSLYGWVMAGLHLPDSATAARIKKFTEEGTAYVRLCFDAMCTDSRYEDFTDKAVDMRLDQIAMGSFDNDGYLPYAYMNGTSMATPAVAGCVAVASSRIQGVSAGERAALTVRALKGAVHQTRGYSDLCKQGGQVDLGILGQADKYVPVLESAEVLGGSVTLKGMYFGSGKGTLTVGGVAVRPSSWSATEITAPWPNGVASGVVPIAVTSGVGTGCRAFMLAAPAGSSESADVYERELAVPNVRADGLSTTAGSYSLTATDGGVLFAAAANVDDQIDETTGYLFRSDDAGASWAPIALPQPLKKVTLAAGDGTLFVLGATPAGALESGTDYWYLYGYDIAGKTFELLNSYDAHASDTAMPHDGALAYAGGSLYVVDCRTDDYGDRPSRMRIRKFDAGYQPGDSVSLKHEYFPLGSAYAPKVSAAGSSIYVSDFQKPITDEGHEYGLERVDVAADGSIFSTDLSSALAGLPDGVDVHDVCIAADEGGVYLVGAGLDSLLPANAAHTDTFFLEKGSSAFVPYSRTLSLAPAYQPTAVCSGGWLYALAVSQYEHAPVFGRATRLPETPASKPEPKKGDVIVKGSYSYTVLSSTEVSVKLAASKEKAITKVNVPATVTLGGKSFKVAKVQAKGFASATKLKSVTLGVNVKTIGARAFAGCANLKSFTATSKVLAKIGASAFKGCGKLTELTIAKTTKLTKSGVEKSLAGSKVSTVDVKNSKKAAYKKCFTEENCGKKVTLK